jgi:hypothetical protein
LTPPSTSRFGVKGYINVYVLLVLLPVLVEEPR